MARPRKQPPREPKRNARRHGQGSVAQVGPGRWRAWTPPDDDGQRQSKRFDSEADAWAWLDSHLAPAPAGEISAGGPDQDFGDYLRSWLRGLQLKPQSTPGYRRAVLYARPLWRVPLDQLNHRHFAQLFAELQRQSPLSAKRGLSAKTVRTARDVLSTALHAATPDLIPANPVHRARVPLPERGKPPHWKLDETRRFLRVARESRWYAFFRLALTIAARPGELRALQWADLDIDRARLLLSRNLDSRSGEAYTTKTSRWREVVLSRAAVRALREHRAAQTMVSKWVFIDARGRTLQARTIEAEFHRLRAIAGVPPMKMYAMRHSGATLLLEDGGLPLPIVSELLGHSNPSITANVYWGSTVHQRQLPADMMDQLLPDEDESDDVEQAAADGPE